MTITDGAIMFAACVLSFTIGYALGVLRLARFVNKQLNEIKGGLAQIDKFNRDLHQYYSKLGDDTVK